MGQRGRCKTRGLYFSPWKRKQKLSIGNRMFLHYRIVTAVKKVELVSDMMLYIVQRGRCVISLFCFYMN